MVNRNLVIGIFILKTVFCSSLKGESKPSDPIATALTSYGYHIEYPGNSNYTCIYSNRSDCHRLEFRIKVRGGHASAARFFAHHDSLRNISLLSPNISEHTRVEDDWTYFDTTPCLHKVREDVFSCSIEYSSVGEVFTQQDGHLPFLVVSRGDNRNRGRRTTSHCSIADSFVDSIDLGMGEAVPQRINLKKCVGLCHVNAGTFSTDYARAMYFSHKKRGRHIPDESWKPTCQITEMESMNLFFKRQADGNVTFVETKVENLVVKSCGCGIHMCSPP